MPPRAAHSLDIVEQQVAVDFFDDAHFSWHMRVLLVNGGGGNPQEAPIIEAPSTEQKADLDRALQTMTAQADAVEQLEREAMAARRVGR